MRIQKRFAVLVLVTFVFFQPVKAAPETHAADLTLSLSAPVVEDGGTLSLTVGTRNWVNVTGGIVGFNFKIQYDDSRFTYQSVQVTAKSGINPVKDTFTVLPSKGVLSVLYLDQDFKSPVPTACSLLTITFRAKGGHSAQKCLFRLSGDASMVDGKMPQADSVAAHYPPDGAVTIKAGGRGNAALNDSAGDASVQKVVERINSLPQPVTERDRRTVSEAQSAYDRLTPNQQYQVVNREKLQQAQTSLAKLSRAKAVKTAVIAIVLAVFLAGALFVLHTGKHGKGKKPFQNKT